MKIQVQLPRISEADVDHKPNKDVIITPIFYRRNGFSPFMHFTVTNDLGVIERYVLSVNGSNMNLRVDHLVPVTPACEDKSKQEKENAATKSGDTTAEN